MVLTSNYPPLDVCGTAANRRVRRRTHGWRCADPHRYPSTCGAVGDLAPKRKGSSARQGYATTVVEPLATGTP